MMGWIEIYVCIQYINIIYDIVVYVIRLTNIIYIYSIETDFVLEFTIHIFYYTISSNT